VRWKDVDAQTDTKLVDGKVQSLQAVAKKPAQGNVSVRTR
jgi:hypothetical protein